MSPSASTRIATLSDLPALLPLFRNLDEVGSEPPDDQAASNAWNRLLSMAGVKVIVATSDHNPEILLATCTIVIIPNVTHSARPHALIENVSTLREQRNRGYGRMVVEAALEAAWEENCYKVVLSTGSKRETTLRFYQNIGFERGVRTIFSMRKD